MKKISFIICLMLVFTLGLSAQTSVKTKVETRAAQIAKRLKLDEAAATSVYNVVKHIDSRIQDLALGTPDYEKLINYIAEEREQMMKAALPKDKFKEYKKLYSEREKNEIKSLITKNESFVKREKSKNDREERISKSIMERDMKKALAEERKAISPKGSGI
ncbi:MAG: hypothetical protein LBL90_00285 [Prevotellaceae bacterium]|jgi:hypothetical protein|nr:hypothetical protein [Prevotellaceae bacterium]